MGLYYPWRSIEQDRPLYLEGIWSMRTRKVEGPNTNSRDQPTRNWWLLARGHQVDRLFKGKNGYAFEALFARKGDRILLHAEEQSGQLQWPNFQANEEFTTLTEFFVEKVVLQYRDFYSFLSTTTWLRRLFKKLEASVVPDLTLTKWTDLGPLSGQGHLEPL